MILAWASPFNEEKNIIERSFFYVLAIWLDVIDKW